MTDQNRDIFRHAMATFAYRLEKATRDAPEDFAEFKCGDSSRTPVQIVAHVSDLFDWAFWIAVGEMRWQNSEPRGWNAEVDRLFDAVKRFDDLIASDAIIHVSLEKLFQGPIADAFQHLGQINFVRRLAGSPVRGENYFQAEIHTGTIGKEQSSVRIEFD